MKGNPFRLNYSRDGSFRFTTKKGEWQSAESKFKEAYFSQNGIKNLDLLRPDGYKDGVWYEAKVGSEKMIGTNWLRGSKYFPSLYFPPYYFTSEHDIDSQIESYVSYGYCPLQVVVFDYGSGEVIGCITISCNKSINECVGDKD